MAVENLQIHPYESSGGDSVEIYVDDKIVRVEAHEDSYAIILPTELSLPEGWAAVSPLISQPAKDSEAILGKSDNQNNRNLEPDLVPSDEAIKLINENGSKYTWVRIDTDKDVFTWGPNAYGGNYTEVGLGMQEYDSNNLTKIIKAAGSIAVSEAVDEITKIANPLLQKYNKTS